MHISELSKHGIPDEFIEKFKDEKIENLYPPQEDAIKHGLLEGKSIVLSVPTAAGKTLTAALAAIKKLSSTQTKVVYIVPLVALANEKYNYFKKLLGEKRRTVISVGNLDSSNPKLGQYDFIVCTTEKLDSLIRHGADWVKDIGLVIVDEIHLLNDMSRGPTLEILITRLKAIVPNTQILGLSATINNSNELADWLDAELVVSDFRPVKLYEGVSVGDKIHFLGKDDYEIDIDMTDQDSAILKNTLKMKKQALFFVSSRRNAEGLAKKLVGPVRRELTQTERKELTKLSDGVLNVLESPTRQCRKLADCIRSGSAFHHAGLLRKQKQLVENAFRAGLVKSIAATPTLAMGVNLPAFRVIIRDAKRYYGGIGMAYIPILEYKQFVGRAGRPQYDDFGESILVAKTENSADELTERFILGEPEKIKSKLAVEPVLRTHTLALVASGFTKTEEELLEFFSKTFYAYQYGEISTIEENLMGVLDALKSWGFITETSGEIRPTKIGKRVSELYLDPLTAYKFVNSLRSPKIEKRIPHTFSIIQVISNTIEMKPLLYIKVGEFEGLNSVIAERGHMFLQNIPSEWDIEFDLFLRSVKTAMLFESWLNEKTEDQILQAFRVAPGELRWRLHTADWLVYSLQELALLLGMKDVLKDIRKLRVRLRYGVREDLMPLVRLKSIGRVRARKLYIKGLKTVNDLRRIPLQSLSRIIGPNIAYNIKEQLGENVGKPKTEKQKVLDTFS